MGPFKVEFQFDIDDAHAVNTALSLWAERHGEGSLKDLIQTAPDRMGILLAGICEEWVDQHIKREEGSIPILTPHCDAFGALIVPVVLNPDEGQLRRMGQACLKMRTDLGRVESPDWDLDIEEVFNQIFIRWLGDETPDKMGGPIERGE